MAFTLLILIHVAVALSAVVIGAFTLLPGRRLGDLVWQAAGLV